MNLYKIPKVRKQIQALAASSTEIYSFMQKLSEERGDISIPVEQTENKIFSNKILDRRLLLKLYREA